MSETSENSAIQKIPVNEMSALLDAKGLKQTWLDLLATLASVSFTHPAAANLLASTAYEKAFPDKETNLLDNLSIGQIGILYEYSLAYVDHHSRKAGGQYFTPDDIANFLSEKSDSFPDGVWLDPCCGVGNLSYWLAVRQEDPEDFILSSLYLMDLDETALFIARSLFTLFFYFEDENLFENLEPRFIAGNFLDADIPEHDFALLNPPYVQSPPDERFETAGARDRYAFFLERIIKSSCGFISITPQSFTNSKRFSSLRRLLLERYTDLTIYAFDNIPDSIFKGVKFGSTNTNQVNSTRAGVIVAGPADRVVGQPVVKRHRITPLLRWTTKNREQMLERVDEFLTDIELTEAIFPKVDPHLKDLWEITQSWEVLASHLSKEPTEFKLILPAAPRYFTPAVRRELERSSFHEIYLKSKEDYDKFYVLLNSSLLYWWWRVNDGGMTLALETLKTLPIPTSLEELKNSEGIEPLVSQLEESEEINLVIKMNAGKPNENVKHPLTLVDEVNKSLFNEKDAGALLWTHRNSFI